MPTESPEDTWNDFFVLSLEQLSSSKLNYKWVWRAIMFLTLPVLGVFFLGISRLERLSGILWADIDSWCLAWLIENVILHPELAMQWLRGSCQSLISLFMSNFILGQQKSLTLWIHFIDLISSNSNMILLSSSGTSFTHKKVGTGEA